MEIIKIKKMKKHYLPFEKPLKDLDFEIEKLSASELESENSLLFKITLTPFGNIASPSFNQ